MIADRFDGRDCAKGVISTVFRTVAQAQALDATGRARHGAGCHHRDGSMTRPWSTNLRPLHLRGKCGALDQPGRQKKSGICDACGASVQPAPDNATIAAHQEISAKAPILPYYKGKSILRQVDGMASVEEVARQIDAVLAGV
jgi:adenylate kinase